MAEKVSATEAKTQLSALISRTGYEGERFVIERRGRLLAALVGVEDLERSEKAQSADTSRPLGAIALVGAWAEAEGKDLDAVLDEIYVGRERDTGRPVDLGA